MPDNLGAPLDYSGLPPDVLAGLQLVNLGPGLPSQPAIQQHPGAQQAAGAASGRPAPGGTQVATEAALRHLVQLAMTPQHPDQQTALRHLVQLAAMGLPAGALQQNPSQGTDQSVSPNPLNDLLQQSQARLGNVMNREGMTPDPMTALQLLGIVHPGLITGGMPMLPNYTQRDIQQYPQQQRNPAPAPESYLGY